MKTRTWSGDTEVTEIGLGCWQSGGGWGRPWSHDTALEVFHAAYDSGVRFFDTANVYGAEMGDSEESLGRFLKDHNDVFVATKVGRGPIYPDGYSYDHIKADVVASLKRLGIECVDLIQLHCVPTQVMKDGEIFGHMRRLKQEGLIKDFGASVESVEEGMFCLEQDDIASLQVIFNIFRQKPAEDLLPKAKAHGVGIIVRLPLASGLLTGKITRETTFAPDDHRTVNRNGEHFNVGETFAGLELKRGIDCAEQLMGMLPGEYPMAQNAIRWILDHEAVTVVIPGASRPSQAKANVMASDQPSISSELHNALHEWYLKEVRDYIRGPY